MELSNDLLLLNTGTNVDGRQ